MLASLLSVSGADTRVPVRKKTAPVLPVPPGLPEPAKKETPPPAPSTTPLKPTATVAPKVEWKPVYHKGRAYVPVEQVASYYDLSEPRADGKTITMASKQFTIGMARGEKRVTLNGWTFYFSFTVAAVKDQT